jgi:flagellar protein FliO/FliZ
VFSLIIAGLLVFSAAPPSQAEEKAEQQKVEKTASREEGDVTGKNENRDKKKDTGSGLMSKEYTEKDFRPQEEGDSYISLVLKTFLVVGLLIVGFLFFYRFVTKKIGFPAVGGDVSTVLAIVPIGQNKYLQVIDLAGKVLVLGVADNGINLITEITDSEEKDRIRLMSSRAPAEQKDFSEWIGRHIGNLINRVQSRDKNETTVTGFSQGEQVDLSYLQRQKDRLKGLNGGSDE